MKKNRLIVGIVMATIIIASMLIFLLKHTDSAKTCDSVKKATVPTDVGGMPNDIYTGQAAIDICKQLMPNPMTEGGRAIFEYR